MCYQNFQFYSNNKCHLKIIWCYTIVVFITSSDWKKLVIIDATKYCDCLNTLNELNSVLQSKIDLGRQCPEICSLAHGPRGAVGYPLVKWSDWHGTSQCLVPKWTWCSFYQPIYGMKGSVNFAQLQDRTLNLWRGSSRH